MRNLLTQELAISALAASIGDNFVPVPESGCWLWLGKWDRKNYGVHRTRSGAWFGVHRLFFAAIHGDLLTHEFICHKCDVPACVNPDHLFKAFHKENMADMARKKRARDASGEKNSRALLTRDQVLAIFTDRRPATEIAPDYGVSARAVRDIKTRGTWKDVTE